jgi:organic radical activating enzyme
MDPAPLRQVTRLLAELTQRCNCRCQHCESWTHNSTKDADIDTVCRIIREMAPRKAPGARYVPCGGELTVSWDLLETTCREAQAAGYRVTVVTNGSMGADTARLLEFVNDVNVSFDADNAYWHDKLRGVRGSFQSAEDAMTSCIAHKRPDQEVRPMVLISQPSSLQHAYNLGEAFHVRPKLSWAQPTFARSQGEDKFWFHARWKMSLLDSLEPFKVSDFTASFLNDLGSYLDGLSEQKPPDSLRGWAGDPKTGRPMCGAFPGNLHVDRQGVMRGCWGKGPGWPSLQYKADGDAVRFFDSLTEQPFKGCRRMCGMSHSVRGSKTWRD